MVSLKSWFRFALALLLGVASCVREALPVQEDQAQVRIRVRCGVEPDPVRSAFSGSDDAVLDWSLFVYYGGRLEQTLFSGDGDVLNLVSGQFYHLYALANTGRVEAPQNESALVNWWIRPQNPATFNGGGLPMACETVYVAPQVSGDLYLQMTRLVARYDLSIDRTAMQKSDFQVRSVALRQVASEIRPFSETSAATLVTDGDTASTSDIQRLRAGYAVSFYMLENSQGVLLGEGAGPWDKVPSSIPARQALCTYLEVSGDWSTPGVQAGMMYRMYLGRDNSRDFNIDRNTTNSVELCLTDEGALRDSWKVWRTGINDARVLHFDRDELTVYRRRGYARAAVLCDPAGVEYSVTGDAALAQTLQLDYYREGDSLFVRSQAPYAPDAQMLLYLTTWDGVCADSLRIRLTDSDPVLTHYTYATPELTLSYGLVPADGSAVGASIHYAQARQAHYDNGEVRDAEPLSGTIDPAATSGDAFIQAVSAVVLSGGSVNAVLGQPGTASVSGAHLGTTQTGEREIIRVSVQCSVNGVSAVAESVVRQQANTVSSIWMESYERYDWQLEVSIDGYGTQDNPCPRAGGVVTMSTRASHMQVDHQFIWDQYASGSVVDRDHYQSAPYRYADYNNLSYTSGERFSTIQETGREEIDGVGHRYFSLAIPENNTGSVRQGVYSSTMQDGSFQRIDLRIYQAATDPDPDPEPDPDPVLTSLSVSPTSQTVRIGSAFYLTVKAHYSDGSVMDVTSSASFSHTGSCISIALGGRISGLSLGDATVTASYGGMSATCEVEVIRPLLAGLNLNPASAQLTSDRYCYIRISPQPSMAELGDIGNYSFGLGQDELISHQAFHDNGDGTYNLSLHGGQFNGTDNAVISNGEGISATLPLSNQVVITSVGSASGKGIPTVHDAVIASDDGFRLAVYTPEDPDEWLAGGSDALTVQISDPYADRTSLFAISFEYTPASYPVDDAGVTYIRITHPSSCPTKKSYPSVYRNVTVTVTSQVRGKSYTYPLESLTTYYY